MKRVSVASKLRCTIGFLRASLYLRVSPYLRVSLLGFRSSYSPAGRNCLWASRRPLWPDDHCTYVDTLDLPRQGVEVGIWKLTSLRHLTLGSQNTSAHDLGVAASPPSPAQHHRTAPAPTAPAAPSPRMIGKARRTRERLQHTPHRKPAHEGNNAAPAPRPSVRPPSPSAAGMR